MRRHGSIKRSCRAVTFSGATPIDKEHRFSSGWIAGWFRPVPTSYRRVSAWWQYRDLYPVQSLTGLEFDSPALRLKLFQNATCKTGWRFYC